MKGSVMATIKEAPKVHVIGIAGQEGRAVFDFLINKGIKVIGHENTPKTDFREKFLSYSDAHTEEEAKAMAEKFLSSGADIFFSDRYLSGIDKGDVVIVSQAYRRYPANKSIIERGATGDINLFQAIELAFDVAPCRIIGVTGTAGKSTTVSLIGGIISASGRKMYFSGNDREDKWDLNELERIGEEGMALFEISHRHLMDLKSSPDIAVITNIYPHHLDDAGSFENYVELKKNLIRHQSEKGKAVVNWSLISKGLVRPEDTLAEILSFGGPEDISSGIVKDGKIFIEKGERKEEIASVEELPFKGEHNIQNALAAAVAMSDFPVSDIRRGLLSWEPLKYRLQEIWSNGEKLVINDGKSSDPLATIEAVRATPNISVLVMGGIREGFKTGDFIPLAHEIAESTVKTIVIYGKSRENIVNDLEPILNAKNKKLISVDNHNAAFEEAFKAHKTGALVFSPACQSFDEFRDFRERGEAWNKAVLENYGK